MNPDPERLVERLDRIVRNAEEVGWCGADLDAMRDAAAYISSTCYSVRVGTPVLFTIEREQP